MKFEFSKLSLTLFSALLLGCGGTDDARVEGGSSTQLAADSDLSQATVSASLTESLDSLSDTNLVVSSGTSLALSGAALENTATVDKTCAVAGDTAVVTINRDRTNTWELTTKRMTISSSLVASQDIVRTWSKEGTAIACSGKSAAIDFEGDLTGYKLDVTVDRTAERSFERTLIKTQEAVKSSSKNVSKGTRSVEWLSQTANADGTFTRSKSIAFSVAHSIAIVNAKKEAKAIDLKVETKADAPLKVAVTWDKLSEGRALQSKLIKSGTIVASKDGAGSMEATFSNILLTFTADACALTSGSMTAKVYAEGKTEVSKAYALTAVDGDVTVEDVTDAANPVAVDDFEYSPCDLKDFQQ